MDRPRLADVSAAMAAVAEQLRAVVVRYPSEQERPTEGPLLSESVLSLAARIGHGQWAWMPRSRRASLVDAGNGTWAWLPRRMRASEYLQFPTTDVADPARCWAEKLATEARVAFARELAVTFARVFPREVIIRIHLEVFWGDGTPA